jgi:hypothetical protein
MGDVIDDEAAAKLIKHLRQNDQDSPHLQATLINFIWSIHESEGAIDSIELEPGEVEEILEPLPTNPKAELDHMDETVLETGGDGPV